MRYQYARLAGRRSWLAGAAELALAGAFSALIAWSEDSSPTDVPSHSSQHEPEQFHLKRGDVIPNNPRLPVLLYRGALGSGGDLAWLQDRLQHT